MRNEWVNMLLVKSLVYHYLPHKFHFIYNHLIQNVKWVVKEKKEEAGTFIKHNLDVDGDFEAATYQVVRYFLLHFVIIMTNFSRSFIQITVLGPILYNITTRLMNNIYQLLSLLEMINVRLIPLQVFTTMI